MDSLSLWQLLLHFDQHLGAAIAHYGPLVYAILFAVVFAEIGVLPLFFLPGDPLLFICGAFCASGYLSLWVLMPLLFVAALGGSLLNYGVGRAIGMKVLGRQLRWIDQAALERTHRFYAEHGDVTFLLSPFIAVVRTFAPFVGGIAGMGAARFLLAAAAGALLWSVSLPVLGYFFGNVPQVRDHMGAIVLSGIVMGVGALVVANVWRRLRVGR
jgi:membrane-associated protein